ncbi:MAG: alpha/beta fold hydrolase [Burkholderiaceae bacterium]
MRAERIRASDGTELSARVYEPDSPDQGSVVIGGAMGVRQDFYAPFARWLASQGWRVTTFDYRGSGDSLPRGHSLRGFKADLFDWTRDYEAAIDLAHAALPDRPLYLLGHSLGAQLPGLLGNQHKVSGLLSVAAGSGYWRENAPQLKRVVPYFWFVLVPLAVKLCGYFPGRKLRKVGDLPAGVIMQWRKWCLNPRYSVGAEGEGVRQRYANARFPVVALSVDDDELMTLRGTNSLMSLYENAPREIRRVSPADLSVRRLGHFGLFRQEHESLMWPRIGQWLAAFPRAVAP